MTGTGTSFRIARCLCSGHYLNQESLAHLQGTPKPLTCTTTEVWVGNNCIEQTDVVTEAVHMQYLFILIAIARLKG